MDSRALTAAGAGVAACRVLLFAPGDRPEMFAKAVASGADAVILDLEDAVSAAQKSAARDAVTGFFREGFRGRLVSGQLAGLRINPIHTPEGVRDLHALIESGVAPHFVVLPKVESAFEPRHCARVLGAGPHGIELVATIESARGLEEACEIAGADPCVRGLAFGGVDFAADIGAEHGWEPLLYARSRTAQAAAAAGITAIDVPWLAIRDVDGLREESRRVRALGFSAKLAIHPGQVAAVVEVFSPTANELEHARAIVSAYEHARGGVCEHQGKMVDEPVVRIARRTLSLARSGLAV